MFTRCVHFLVRAKFLDETRGYERILITRSQLLQEARSLPRLSCAILLCDQEIKMVIEKGMPRQF